MPIEDMDVLWRIHRVRLFKEGHSFREIDNMSAQDLFDVMGYEHGNHLVEGLNKNGK